MGSPPRGTSLMTFTSSGGRLPVATASMRMNLCSLGGEFGVRHNAGPGAGKVRLHAEAGSVGKRKAPIDEWWQRLSQDGLQRRFHGIVLEEAIAPGRGQQMGGGEQADAGVQPMRAIAPASLDGALRHGQAARQPAPLADVWL